MTENLSDMRDMLDAAGGKSAKNVARGIVADLSKRLYLQAQENTVVPTSEKPKVHTLPNGRKVHTFKQPPKEDSSVAA